MQTNPDSTFYMPAYSGQFFEDETIAAFTEAFHNTRKKGCDIKFIQMLVFLPDDRGERCIPDKDLRFYVAEGSISPEYADTCQASIDAIHAAWGRDALASQAIPALPLPWSVLGASWGRRLSQKYLAINWSPEVTVICQEHIPTFLRFDHSDPIGPGWAAGHRAALACAIVPETHSAHDQIAQHKAHTVAEGEIAFLWQNVTLGCEQEIHLDTSGIKSPYPF